MITLFPGTGYHQEWDAPSTLFRNYIEIIYINSIHSTSCSIQENEIFSPYLLSFRNLSDLFCSHHCSVASFHFPSLPRNFFIVATQFFPGNLHANWFKCFMSLVLSFCDLVELFNPAERGQPAKKLQVLPCHIQWCHPDFRQAKTFYFYTQNNALKYLFQKSHWDQHKLYFIYVWGTK